MSESLTFVLIPGAWHGGWAWHPVAQRLRAAGHSAVCVTLPGMSDGADRAGLGLEDAARHVIEEIESRGLTRVVLVGHSLGGFTLASVASRLRHRVLKMIFFSAVVPVRGSSMNDDNQTEIGEYVKASIEASLDGSIEIPLTGFREDLMRNQPEAVVKLIYSLLAPAPGGYFLDVYDGPDVKSLGIPVTYILAEDEGALPVPGREMAARVAVEPILVPGPHEAMLTHPDEVAQALIEHSCKP